jgi:hypothetical protein
VTHKKKNSGTRTLPQRRNWLCALNHNQRHNLSAAVKVWSGTAEA